jgi:hypothetical protein
MELARRSQVKRTVGDMKARGRFAHALLAASAEGLAQARKPATKPRPHKAATKPRSK